MKVAVLHTPQWTVSARRRGEVLTLSASGAGIELAILSVPDGFSAAELEGWLRDLIGVTQETARGDVEPRAIPALLHHALTGLLFSHAELWERTGARPPCSAAFIAGDDEVGFGWVGEANVRLWLNDLPLDAAWVRVRDQSGREARAISLDARSRVRMQLVWTAEGDESGATLEAQWPFEGVAPEVSAAGETAAALTAAAQAPPAEEPEPVASGEPAMPGEPATASCERIGSDAAPAPDVAEVPGVEASVLKGEPAGQTAARGRARPGGRLVAAMGRITSWWTGRPRTSEGEDAPSTVPATPLLLTPQPSQEPAAGIEEWDPHLRVLGPAGGPAPPALPEVRGPLEARASAGDATEALAGARPPFGPRPVTAAAGITSDADTPPLPGLAGPLARAPGEPAAETAPPHAPSSIEEWIARELGEQMPAPSPPAGVTESAALTPAAGEPVAEAIPAAGGAAPPAAEWQAGDAAPAETEVEDSAMASAAGAPPPARPALRPQWPSASDLDAPTTLWKRPWAWAVLVVALFVGGWLVGGLQGRGGGSGGPRGFGRALRTIGLGGARFDVMVNSRPAGAWIAVDGKDLARRTPASLDLPAGRHQVAFSFPNLGNETYDVTGERGQQLAIDAPLWGSLAVRESDSGLPVSVEMDGEPLGYAPVMLDSVLPGPHELRFSGPGMVPWGQTVEVRVRRNAEVIARPMTSPATGVIEVRATLMDEQGEQPLSGGEVWIDGEPRGRTPLVLELPRGPHSARVVYQGETTPVQVIDLPGGNQRFASFELGGGLDRPRLIEVGIADRISLDRPAVASASLTGIAVTDVKEMWLHVRMPEGTWRRYQMDVLKSTFGVVGVAVFPSMLFDDQGTTRYYMSALTTVGDEYFTEIRTARLETARKAATRP